MASTSTALSLSTPSTLLDARAPRQPVASPNSLALPMPQNRESWKTTSYCRRTARNVVAMATGEAPVMATATADAQPEVSTELPEIVKAAQKKWEKVEDKYAVSTLAVAGIVALWGSTGLISAIDRLPLIPGVLELVGIGYTGWFVYENLVFTPDREALLKKIKDTYSNIIGES